MSERGSEKRRGLSGSRLSFSRHVFACERMGKALRLDGCAVLKSYILDPAEHFIGNIEVGKSRFSFRGRNLL
jgi:hypothetical protein